MSEVKSKQSTVNLLVIRVCQNIQITAMHLYKDGIIPDSPSIHYTVQPTF